MIHRRDGALRRLFAVGGTNPRGRGLRPSSRGRDERKDREDGARLSSSRIVSSSLSGVVTWSSRPFATSCSSAAARGGAGAGTNQAKQRAPSAANSAATVRVGPHAEQQMGSLAAAGIEHVHRRVEQALRGEDDALSSSLGSAPQQFYKHHTQIELDAVVVAISNPTRPADQ